MLNLIEIFYSLQGESSYAGLPCIFIRFADCNLECSYCDTRYACEKGIPRSLDYVFEEIAQYPCKLVEITGGEPVLQEDELILLANRLHEAGYTILLETNGSLYLGDIPPYVIKIVDVKTPGSGMGESFMKWNLKFLQPHDELKFVLTSFYDYHFAHKFITDNSLSERVIHFSPVRELLSPKLLSEWILADGLKVRLQLQLHKIIGIA